MGLRNHGDTGYSPGDYVIFPRHADFARERLLASSPVNLYLSDVRTGLDFPKSGPPRSGQYTPTLKSSLHGLDYGPGSLGN